MRFKFKFKMQESPGLKAEVKAFWNQRSCDTVFASSEKFSRSYFEEIESWRYSTQPFIHSLAQFTRYRGKRVLEVGFGAGTDFIQWLRAGALVSGVDLTEEALANLTERIRIYDLPPPVSIQVADAENLPFPSNTFDLGYSWGVLHHTPNTEQAVAELVRVVRPGGEIKLMLYNRHSLYAAKCWLKFALLRGRPWRSLRWVLWHHVESLGTKAYTRREVSRMLAPLGLNDIRMETFVAPGDRIERTTLPCRLGNAMLGVVVALSGNQFGWYRTIAARKVGGSA